MSDEGTGTHPLDGPRPGSTRPIVGGLVLLTVAGLAGGLDDGGALWLAVLLGGAGTFLFLGGLYFLLLNVDDYLRQRLHPDTPQRG